VLLARAIATDSDRIANTDSSMAPPPPPPLPLLEDELLVPALSLEVVAPELAAN